MPTQNFRRFFEGLGIVPKSSSTAASMGELEVNSGTGKLQYNNGSSTSPVVTEAHSATLTNKVLSSNTASSLINGSGTFNFNSSGVITTPNTTDTLVARNTTDTLTNKTINASSNTISNLSNSNLNGSAAITNANLASMASHTIKGNASGSSAVPSDLTGTQTTALLVNFIGDSGSGGTKGLVPAPSAGDGSSNKFLKADGTWSSPVGAGISAVGSFDSQSPSANGLVISGTSIYAQSADATHPGMVNNTTQTMSGAKIFSTSLQSPLITGTTSVTSPLIIGTTSVRTPLLTSSPDLSITSTGTNADISITSAEGGELRLTTTMGLELWSVHADPDPAETDFNRLYFKLNDKLYSKNSSGVETQITPTPVSPIVPQVSSSSGNFNTTSTSYVDITNLSVTITSFGNPIVISLQCDSLLSSSFQANLNSGSTPYSTEMLLIRDVTNKAVYQVNTPSTTGANYMTVPSFLFIDSIGAGTYTYKLQARVGNSAASFNIANVVLVAYEL